MRNEQLVVYNTLENAKVPFETLVPGKVSMYVCGPTTYNYIHLGNARPIVVFDTIRRYLMYVGYDVTFIQNFTDVDDKIIKRAHEENDDPIQLAARYIDEFFKDVSALNVLPATAYPKVSEHIEEIIDFVQKLVAAGYAYVIEGDVYFSVRKYADYGRLSGRSLDDMQAGARVEVDNRKQDPMDFALWKSAKPGEPSWQSPWGAGRPGWHIECSAMSLKYLGQQFDIHGGGQDLIFPHHENEIAQTCSLTQKPMAKYWLHNGFITINKEKMSKSLGNFFLLRDILDKFDPKTVRFYLLSVHYRSPLDFDDEKLQVAQKGLERLKNAYTALQNGLRMVSADASAEAATELQSEVRRAEEAFKEAMNDDFNTALAIASMFDLAKVVNTYMKQAALDEAALAVAKIAFDGMLSVIGIDFDQSGEQDGEAAEKIMQVIIGLRQQARSVKDFATADFIRDAMSTEGIIIEDTPQGMTWKWADHSAESVDGLMAAVINVRKAARTGKNYALADAIRDELHQAGMILEDTPQGTSWKMV